MRPTAGQNKSIWEDTFCSSFYFCHQMCNQNYELRAIELLSFNNSTGGIIDYEKL